MPTRPLPKTPVDSWTIGRTAAAVLRDKFKGLSVDRILTRPKDAIDLCRQTNTRLCRQLEHEQILQALVNARKRGDLSEKK
jgi:hypothetical protein